MTLTTSRTAPASAASTDDNQLMARMQGGCRDALGELYDRYGDRAYRVAHSVSADGAHADEAVQEAFVSIWDSRATYRPHSATAAPWVLTVVRHRAIDVYRRHAKDDAHQTNDRPLTDCRARDDVAGTAVDRAEARRLLILLARLPDAQRDVILLAFYGQLSHTEIAERLALPIGTVKGRMRLGLQKLRGDV